MLKISKIKYCGEDRIKIDFSYDYRIKEDIKSLKTARFSGTLRAWHIEYSKEEYQALKSLGYKIKLAEFSKSNEEKDNNINSYKKNKKVIKKENQSKEIRLGNNGLTIEIHNSRFYIKTGYNQHRIDIIKTLRSVWWNNKTKIWIAKATIGNLNILQKEFEYWNDFGKIYQIVALIDDPMIMEIYRTPDNIKKVWIKIRGYKINTDFLNRITGKYYDKRFNRWAIPNKPELINKILDYYKSKGVKVINRLPKESKNFYENNKISHRILQKRLIAKYDTKHVNLVTEISDVMIAQRYSWKTINAYIPNIVKFSKYVGNPDIKDIEVSLVNKYIAQVSKEKSSGSTINLVINSIKFYYTKVVYKPEFEIEKIKRPRKQRNLPGILSVGEIERILKALNNLKHIHLTNFAIALPLT